MQKAYLVFCLLLFARPLGAASTCHVYSTSWDEGKAAASVKFCPNDGLYVKTPARSAWALLMRDGRHKSEDGLTTDHVTLTAVIGPFVSYAYDSYCECGGAHPIYGSGSMTINLKENTASSNGGEKNGTNFDPVSVLSLASDPAYGQRILEASKRAFQEASSEDEDDMIEKVKKASSFEELKQISACVADFRIVDRSFCLTQSGNGIQANFHIGYGFSEICRGNHLDFSIPLGQPSDLLQKELSERTKRKDGYLGAAPHQTPRGGVFPDRGK